MSGVGTLNGNAGTGTEGKGKHVKLKKINLKGLKTFR